MNIKKIISLLIIMMSLVLISCQKVGNDVDDNHPQDQTEVEDNKPVSIIKQGEINLFDKYLKYFGRTYFSNGRLALDHCGCGFEVGFKGSNLDLEIIAAPTTVSVDVFIDGEFDTTLKITRNGALKVAKDLTKGEHTIKIIKASSTASGPIYISEISTDGSIKASQSEYKLKIEFVGDSITCGAGVLEDNNSPATTFENSDVCKAYSYVLADMLGADFSISATEGICVKQKTAVSINSIDLYKSYSLNNRSEYEFKQPSDIVIINLGTNDANYLASHPEYKDDFYNDYLELVNLIKEKNPNAQIVCIYGHMMVNEDIKQTIKKVVSDLNNQGFNYIHYFQVTSDLGGAGFHPGMNGAYIQGCELYDYIKNNNIVDGDLIKESVVKPFIDGKKLVVFGDSITALGTWGSEVASSLNMYFYNGAMGGITSSQGIDRFKAVVKDSNADFVTLCFGQNDLIMNTYNSPKVSLEDFKTNMTTLVQMVRDIGAIPILLTTNPLNPDVFWTAQGQNKNNYEEVGGDPLAWLDEYNKVTREVASLTNCDLVDMRNEFSEKYFRNALSDGIHLNARGNEIFVDALLKYFRSRYANDPRAQKVTEENKNIYVTDANHISIISNDIDKWYMLDNSVMQIENVDEAIKFYNTNGLWPDAQYTLSNPIVIDYNSGVLYYDIDIQRVDTSIIIFINGSTPAAYKNGEYVIINSKISENVNAAGDVCGPGHFSGAIKLSDLNIAKAYLDNNNLIISGIKVFVAGTSYQSLTINELSVGLSE